MRTTLALDKKLLEEAMKCSGKKTKTSVVNMALEDFVRRKKLESLKGLSGKVRIDLDWRKTEEEELKSSKEHERRWRGHR